MKKRTLAVIATIASIIIFDSCKKESSQQEEVLASTVQKIDHSRVGVVYIESNESTDALTNRILSYTQNSNGTLTFLAATASGGRGTAAPLGSIGALALDETHHWLFAVNAGSNSISSFSINDDGSINLVQTVSSNGTLPVSLSVFGNWLYVVNSTSANISGFTIGSTGTLTLIPGSNHPLSGAAAMPAQIKFTPDRHLVVTEKNTNKITVFPVTTSGVAGAGIWYSSANAGPCGFGISGNNAIISESAGGAANAATLSSYTLPSYLNSGSTTSCVCGPMHINQTAAFGTVVTADGKNVYVTNRGSNTISSFTTSYGANLQVMNDVEATTGTAPTEIILSNNESYVYVINSMSHSISEYKKSPNASLRSIGEVTGLPANAAGLVAL